MLGKSDRGILRTGAPKLALGLALDYIAKHPLDFWLTTEDLPDPSNRVTVDRQGNIHLAKIYHNTGPHKQLLAKLKDLLGPLGCRRTPIPRWSVLSQRSRSPASPTTAGRCDSAPILGARRLTSTARRTISTTCTVPR
jgi:hypothetical protein